jgi:hypothetical protein
MTTSTYSFKHITGPDRVNDIAAGDQSDPALVTIGDGTGIVFYDNGDKINAKSTYVSGGFDPPAIDVSSGTGATEPKATVLSNGNLVVTWQDGTGNTKILARIYDQNLKPLSDIFVVEGGDVPNKQADIAATADGGFVIVSNDELSASDSDISIDAFDASGKRIHTAAITTNATLDKDASVAVLANGNVAIAWERQTGNNKDVWSAVYSSDLLTVVKAPSAFDADGPINRNVEVAALHDGGFVVSYDENANGNFIIQNQAFSAAGLPGQSYYTGFVQDSDTNAASAVSAEGYLIVAFENHLKPTADIRASLVAPDGSLVAMDRLFEGGGGNQLDPSVSWRNDYTVQLAYATNGKNGDGNGTGISFSQFELVRTSKGDQTNEILSGDGVIDVMKGLGGEDILKGAGGPDKLFGGNDHDMLYGGADDDDVRGGRGKDVLRGGTGLDTFFFAKGDTGNIQATADTIADLHPTHRHFSGGIGLPVLGDKIDLSAIDADRHANGDQAFTFIGQDDFHHTAGELRYDRGKSDTWIYGDTDGNAQADLVLHVDGAVRLQDVAFAL